VQAAGKALAAGGPTPGVKSMCAQMDRLLWSSRPLLYYALSDGLVQAAYAARARVSPAPRAEDGVSSHRGLC